MPNFRAIKISRGTTQPGYEGTITNLQIVLNTQKTPYLNQATPKILAKIFLSKKSRNRKFQTPQKSCDLPCHLKSGVPPSPLPLGLMARH